MKKKALLIGCNYPGTKAELHGCVNDVTRMYKSLVEKFDFAEEDITVMIDTDERSVQPTGVNIKKVLGRLIDEVQPGDVLFLHYSGHGVQVPAETGDEEDDGFDEAIVPTDLNLLTDDDFRLLFKNIKDGVNFTFVSDSCHSGGLIDHEKEQITSREASSGDTRDFVPFTNKSLSLDTLSDMLGDKTGHEVKPGSIRTSLYELFGDNASPTVKVFVNFVADRLSGKQSTGGGGGIFGSVGNFALDLLKSKLDAHGGKPSLPATGISHSGYAGKKPQDPSQRLTDETGILVSGCMSNETSADANPTGDKSQAYGALSNGIQTVLEQRRGPISNWDLVLEVRKLLEKQGFKQHPCLYCSDDNVKRPFICEY